jgi:Rho family protein
VESKWINEINEYCPGVKIVLCALKCDLREEEEEEVKPPEDDPNQPPARRDIIHYKQGLEVAKRIGALRYLGREA